MSSTVVLTYIHTEFEGTEQFRKSCERVGFPIYNAWKKEKYNDTTGSIVRMLYDGLLFLQNKFDKVIYADGADTIFLKRFDVPDYLLISVEKACFPDAALAEKYPFCPTPWKYVNAGNWCGPIKSAIAFFERNGLHMYDGKHINGQREWHHAYLGEIDAISPGKLIHLYDTYLDTECKYMQSIAFEDPGEFEIIIPRNKMEVWPRVTNGDPIVKNNLTGTFPAIFHGNGRTPMSWLYELYK